MPMLVSVVVVVAANDTRQLEHDPGDVVLGVTDLLADPPIQLDQESVTTFYGNRDP